MQQTIPISPTRSDKCVSNVPSNGLPVRTNLRAGLAWDNLDDQAQQLWSSLTTTLSGLIGGSDASS